MSEDADLDELRRRLEQYWNRSAGASKATYVFTRPEDPDWNAKLPFDGPYLIPWFVVADRETKNDTSECVVKETESLLEQHPEKEILQPLRKLVETAKTLESAGEEHGGEQDSLWQLATSCRRKFENRYKQNEQPDALSMEAYSLIGRLLRVSGKPRPLAVVVHLQSLAWKLRALVFCAGRNVERATPMFEGAQAVEKVVAGESTDAKEILAQVSCRLRKLPHSLLLSSYLKYVDEAEIILNMGPSTNWEEPFRLEDPAMALLGNVQCEQEGSAMEGGGSTSALAAGSPPVPLSFPDVRQSFTRTGHASAAPVLPSSSPDQVTAGVMAELDSIKGMLICNTASQAQFENTFDVNTGHVSCIKLIAGEARLRTLIVDSRLVKWYVDSDTGEAIRCAVDTLLDSMTKIADLKLPNRAQSQYHPPVRRFIEVRGATAAMRNLLFPVQPHPSTKVLETSMKMLKNIVVHALVAAEKTPKQGWKRRCSGASFESQVEANASNTDSVAALRNYIRESKSESGT